MQKVSAVAFRANGVIHVTLVGEFPDDGADKIEIVVQKRMSMSLPIATMAVAAAPAKSLHKMQASVLPRRSDIIRDCLGAIKEAAIDGFSTVDESNFSPDMVPSEEPIEVGEGVWGPVLLDAVGRVNKMRKEYECLEVSGKVIRKTLNMTFAETAELLADMIIDCNK